MNLKRRQKISGILEIAQACKYLYELYGSYSGVAKKVGVSDKTILEYTKITDLPKEIKYFIQLGLLSGRDIPNLLARIKDFQRMMESAKAVSNMRRDDARDTIRYILKNPEKSVKECKQRIIKSKGITIDIHVIVVPLSDSIIKIMKEKSNQVSLDSFIRDTIIEWFQPISSLSCTIKNNVLALTLQEEDYLKLRTNAENIALEDYVRDSLLKLLT